MGSVAKRLAMVALTAGVCVAGAPATAPAAPPEPLWQVPQNGQGGTEAGRLQSPAGIASDPTSGHVYVIEQGANGSGSEIDQQGNHRISEFTAWGEFVKAFGWGVADGSEELQACGPGATPPTADCQSGIEGDGAGQLGRWAHGLAIDAEGDLYIYEDSERFRVQKLDPTAGTSGNEVEFIWMAGGEVNKTKSAESGSTEAERNLCTAPQLEAGDECGTGTQGTGMGQFTGGMTAYRVGGSYLAVSPDPEGTLYVGDKDRIQEFDPQSGAYQSEIALPNGGEGFTRALEVDPDGELYFVFANGPAIGEDPSPEHPDVYKRTAAGWEVFAEVEWPRDLASDSNGNIYALDEEESGEGEVLQFTPGGDCVVCAGEGFATPPPRDTLIEQLWVRGLAAGSYCGPVNVYASYYDKTIFGDPAEEYLSAFGSLPDPEICPPPRNPPQITEQYAPSVGSVGATVGAAINPRFWGDTTYYVQFGTGNCSEGGCDMQSPASPASLGEAANFPIATAGVRLPGLEPGTEYHYRFVAESTGGGPVFGVEGAEARFRTLPLPGPANADCANQGLRASASANLPDCRAYEMVSPVDKANGDIVAVKNINSNPAALDRSSLSGERFTYSSYRAFADPQSAPFASQYLADRDSERGWESESISAPRGGRSLLPQGTSLDTEFRAFSADLCSGWLLYDSLPALDPDVPPGFASLYRRDNCGGGYEGLIETQPTNRPPTLFAPEPQAVSDNGHLVFRADDKLNAYAPDPAERDYLLYLADGEGRLRLVSVLPSGIPFNGPTSAGSASTGSGIRFASVTNAISADGSRVFWSDNGNGLGHLYVRINADKVQSGVVGGECTQPDRACTLAVSETVSSEAAQYWTAAADGSKVLFTVDGDLYEFDVQTREPTLIAGEVDGLLGASEDASRIYLVSREDRGGAAVAGKPNLYLYEGGSFAFIATLTEADAQVETLGQPSPVNRRPIRNTSRVSPDGLHAVFMSNGSLTGQDTTDANSGEPDAQVYRYEAGGDVACVSCNPSGKRPAGRNITGANAFWAASQIPSGQSQIQRPRVLSADGNRVFFESFESLVVGDANGAKQDVYQWEKDGEGDCDENVNTLTSLYVDKSGGCVSLISSGEENSDSRFLEASPEGEDTFFATGESLVAKDPGLVDVYDARVNGGFAPPPPPPTPCEGDACQSPPEPPEPEEPASSAFEGPGNLDEAPPSRCALRLRRARRMTLRARRYVRNGRKVARRTNAKRLSRPAARRNLRRVRGMRRRAHRFGSRAKVLRKQARRCAVVQRKRVQANRGGAR